MATTTIAAQAGEAIAADDLSAATAILVEGVRARPQDTSLRLLFIDCLILAGDYERADKQADMAQGFAGAATTGFGVLRLQLRAMQARKAWFETAAAPSFPLGPTPCDTEALRLNLALAAGDATGAQAALDALEALRGEVPATVDGRRVEDLRDLDDRLPHAVEALTTGGAYLWIDYARLASLEFAPAARLSERAFRRARLALADGSSADVLVPQIYPGADADDLRLGRRTDFRPLECGLTLAVGQRALLAGEEMLALSSITRIARDA